MIRSLLLRSHVITSIVLVSLLTNHSFAGDLESDLQNALDELDRGTELLETQDPRSTAILAQSSAMIETVIHDHSFETPGVYLALANSYILRGETGHAILAYRRGEQLDPTDIKLQESLTHARSLVPTQVDSTATSRAWHWLLIWRGYVSRTTLLSISVGLFTLGWIMCTGRILQLVPRSVALFGVWMIASSVLIAGMLASEWYKYSGSTDAVIVQSDVVARTGPDDQLYDPIYEESLAAGVEGRILEQREAWSRVVLGDGSECWIPTGSYILINGS
jgi:hypothetical protein